MGSPNSGKTTLFNHLTGSKQKTVNYPGSTVDFAQGALIGHSDVIVVDIPGIYSLSPKAEDEKVAIRAIKNLSSLIKDAQIFMAISVVDSTQRSRQLSVTKQILDLEIPTVIALTMTDIAFKQEKQINIDQLSQDIGVPIIGVNGRTGGNTTGLKHILLDAISKQNHPPKIKPIKKMPDHYYEETRYWAESIVNKYGSRPQEKVSTVSDILDKLTLHPVYGLLSFFLILGGFFYSIFSLATPLMDGIDGVFSFLSNSLQLLPLPSKMQAFLNEGVLNALASIFVFLPQIAILFLGINILESSGYLARAAVLVDKPLSKIGLSGRAFVPLLSGCACAIPALMAARNIASHRQRLVCMFIIPLMQCAARLPVYGLLLAFLFPKQPLKSAIALTSIYIGSIIIASLVARLVAYWLDVEKKQGVFHLELPSWKLPILKNILLSVWFQSRSFVVGAGPVIFTISLILWVLSYYPSSDYSFIMMVGQWIEPLFAPMGVDWRVGVAILLSFAAREVFVSVLAVMFSINTDVSSIRDVLSLATHADGSGLIFTVPVIVGLIFFLWLRFSVVQPLLLQEKK